MNCRCGHGRHLHRRASGKKNLPCQWRTMGAYPDPRVKTCKCRNYVQAAPIG